MKIKLIVLIAVALLALTSVTVVNAAPKNSTKQTKKIVKPTTKKKPIVKTTKNGKKILGANTFGATLFTLVPCNMPDGKIIRVPKKDCDAVTAFWKSIKPNNPPASNSGGGNSGGGSNNSNNNNSNNNPAPTTTVTNATVLPCGSSSCFGVSTVKVTGTNFSNDSRIELTRNNLTYSQNTNYNNTPDAILTGGNGSTEVIMDFFNLPSGTYGVQIVMPGKTIVSPNNISI